MPSSISTKMPKSAMLRTLPLHDGARRVLLRERLVRVRLELLHAERDAVLLDGSMSSTTASTMSPTATIFDGCLTRRVHDISRDVDEALDALLELDERAVVLERDDLALARRCRACTSRPRGVHGSSRDLLETERDALGLGVELEHLDANVIADLEQLGRVIDPAPAHVGDVQQAVDAAEVDERAVLGEVLDDALDDLAFLELLERLTP